MHFYLNMKVHIAFGALLFVFIDGLENGRYLHSHQCDTFA